MKLNAEHILLQPSVVLQPPTCFVCKEHTYSNWNFIYKCIDENVQLHQKYFPIRFSLSIISMHPQKSFHWLVLTYFTFYFMLRENRPECCHFRALIPSGVNPKVHKAFEQKYLIKLKPLIQPHNYCHIWLCSYRVPSYHQDIPAVLLIYSWTYIV